MKKYIFIFSLVLVYIVFCSDVTFASDKEIRIGLSRYENSTNLQIKNNSILVGYIKKQVDAVNVFSVRKYNNSIALYDGENVVEVFENSETLEITALDGQYINLQNHSYRGKIRFLLNGSGGITVINLIDVDEYLYSVVPSEMPSSWHSEALKAQAVAARTYTYTRIGTHNKDGYDLCDIDHCQNYLGVTNEQVSSTQAVNETLGVMIYYDDKLIDAVYFSSSGGTTESSENVWYEAVPYLRGVREVSEDSYKEWSRTFTLDEIKNIALQNGVNIGNITKVEITQISEMGRINELTISGTNGSKKLEKEEIRSFFKSSDGGSLESRNFTIGNWSNENNNFAKIMLTNGNVIEEKNLNEIFVASINELSTSLNNAVVESASSQTNYTENKVFNKETSSIGNTVTFTGRGWGHGVGMSQYGAYGMANVGYTYKDILKFYYTGVKVE